MAKPKKTAPAKPPPPEAPKTSIAVYGRALGLSIAAGVLYFLGFAGFDLWPFALVCLVPLFLALDWPGAPIKQSHAIVVGLNFGLVTNLGGYYWLVEMLENFSGFHFLLCVLFASILCFYQGGLLALFSWLWWRGRARGWPATLVAVAAFAAAEVAFPLLFQSYLGNSFHMLPAAIQIADLGGPILVSIVAVLVNSAIYEIVRARMTKERLPRVAPAVALGAVVLTLAYGAFRISEVDARAARAPKIRVATVQVNMGIFDKREDPLEGRRRHIEDTRDLERDVRPDLVIWPESAYTFFIEEGTTNVRRYVLGPVRTPVLFGGLARRQVEVDGREVEKHYNTAFITDANGDVQGTYDKTYLLAFGEYLPFGETFPVLYEISQNSGQFTPGSHVRPLPFGRYRISTLVCYEDILPRFVRKAVDYADPHLLVNITNDAWFGDTHEPWIHLALAKFRAVEHHRYLVRSTNSGVSAIIDPVGRTLSHTGVFTRETLHADVAMMRGWTLYQTLGDWPGYLGALAILFMAFLRKRANPVHGSLPQGQ